MKFYSASGAVTRSITFNYRAPSAALPFARCTPPLHILLVDDEIECWWESCLSALAQAGRHVETAEDGEAGWETLQNSHYDLLITDNKMPGITGVELVINLRRQGMSLPVVFASSLLPIITPEQKQYFSNVQFLEKPVSPAEILTLVDRLVRPSLGVCRPISIPHVMQTMPQLV